MTTPTIAAPDHVRLGSVAHIAAVSAFIGRDAETLRELAEANPEDWTVQREAARFAIDTKQLDVAGRYLGQAIKHGGSGDWDLWQLVAAWKSQCGQMGEAEAAITLACRLGEQGTLGKGHPALWATSAIYAFHRGDAQQAHVLLDRCLSARILHPEDERAQGEAHILLGQWKIGWEKADARLGMRRVQVHQPDVPKLTTRNGKCRRIPGKRVILWGEQGQGDQVQFLRFVEPFQRATGANVVLKIIPTLVPWVASLVERGVVEGVSLDGNVGADYQYPLLSLPRALRVWGPAEMPAPYAPPIPSTPVKGRIGYCWKGNPEHPNDHDRSCPEREMWMQGLGVADAWVNLTFGDDDGPTGDWMDTARQIATCEAVVTVDTAIAHVAGSLGVPTVMIGPSALEWRWGVHGSNSPWYPSMYMIRKRWIYGWPEAFAEARTALPEMKT